MDKQHRDCWLIQEKDFISPKEISQRRLVCSSPADTFYNLIDRAYFLLKTSQVGLTRAELTSILAGFSLSFVTKSGQRNKPKENLSDSVEGLLSKTQHCIFTRKQV